MKLKTITLALTVMLGFTQSASGMRRAGNALKKTFRTTRRTFKGNNFKANAAKFSKASLVLGSGLGLGYAMQNDLDESKAEIVENQVPNSIENLDITDINAILNALKEATEEEKQFIAQKFACNIHYDALTQIISPLDLKRFDGLFNGLDVFELYCLCSNTSRCISKKINEYSQAELATILKAYQTQIYLSQSHLETIFSQCTPETEEEIIRLTTKQIQTTGSVVFEAFLGGCSAQNKQKFFTLMVDQHFEMLLTWLDNFYHRKLAEVCPSQVLPKLNKVIVYNIELILQKSGSRALENILGVCNATSREVLLNGMLRTLKTNYKQYTTEDLLEIVALSRKHNYHTSEFIHVILEDMGNNIGAYQRQDLSPFLCLGHMFNKASTQDQNAIMDFIISHLDTDDFFRLPLDFTIDFEEDASKYLEKLFSKEAIQKLNTLISKKMNTLYGTLIGTNQSTGHLEKNALLSWNYAQKIINNKEWKNAFSQALQYEQIVKDKTAVFYHSQKSPVYWLEMLYTKLWERKYHQKNNNYIFTRFPDDCSNWSNAVLQYKGLQTRNEILALGRSQDQKQLEIRPYLLFVNYALFANATNWGSCSAFYFLEDWNVSEPSITSQMILGNFGNQKLYDTYKSEIDAIEREFKELIPNSVLLQFVLPHHTLQGCVYLAYPGGYKKKLEINGKETDNINSILHVLKTAPDTIADSDRQEFCIAMTDDAVHSLREQGAQIRVYGAHDQEKFGQLMEKLETLVDRIAKENPEHFSPQLTPIQGYETYKDIIDTLVVNQKD